jgi:hypothetical protein
MVGSPGQQLADPDHHQWSPHSAQICAAGAERGIDAATAPNGDTVRVLWNVSITQCDAPRGSTSIRPIADGPGQL